MFLLYVVLSKLADEVFFAPSVGAHGGTLGILSELLIQCRITVRAASSFVAILVAEDDPQSEGFALVPVCPAERLMPVELPIPPSASVAE